MSTPRKRKINLDKRIEKRIKEKHILLTERICKNDPKKAGLMASLMDIDYILMNNQIEWDMDELSKNPKVSISFIKNQPEWDWNWNKLTNNFIKRCDLDEIVENPDMDWDWNYLSDEYKCSDWDFISKNFHKPWNLKKLSDRLDFSFDILVKYPDEDWVFEDIVEATDFGLDIIKKCPDLDWPWYKLHKCVKFEWDWVTTYPEKDWSWSTVYWTEKGFRKIPFDIFSKNRDKLLMSEQIITNYVVFKDVPEEEILKILSFKLAIQVIPFSLDRIYELIEEYDLVGEMSDIDVFKGPQGIKRRKILIENEKKNEEAAFKIQWWWKGILENPHHPKGYAYEKNRISKMLRE